jgi:hypothetical protein
MGGADNRLIAKKKESPVRLSFVLKHALDPVRIVLPVVLS